MDCLKGLQNRKTDLLGFMLSSTAKVFLEILDFTSVLTCLWTISWLIYLCFLKDFADIAVYSILKLGNRIIWLLNISGVSNLIQSVLRTEKFVYSKHSADDVDADVFETSPARLSVTSYEVKNMQEMPPATPYTSKCTLINPRRVKLNLEEEKAKDVAYVSPVQQSYFKPKIFNWIFFTKRRSNSYSPHNYSMSEKDFLKRQETIARTPSAFGDSTHLIVNESPDRIGCCDRIFSFLSRRFYVKENAPSVRYERF